jgi:MerR family redox-sensitive transcriptional activator SoxR
MDEAELTIGEVAKRAGVATSAIRYYERVGVLPAATRVSGQRRYGLETVGRLETIAVAQRAGFNLDEIAQLLRSSESREASVELRALAERKLPEVKALIERAQKMREWLEVAQGCGCQTLDECELFDSQPTTRSELSIMSRGARTPA